MKTPIGKRGLRLGFVTIEQRIGKKDSEQGEVWLAQAVGYKHKKFVVKISLKPVSGRRDRAFLDFQNEFAMLASLDHPNIVKVFTCDILNETKSRLYPYYVMEYLGKAVAPFDEAYPKCPDSKKICLCLNALLDTSSALRQVHIEKSGDKGCHRDIKAANILVCKQTNRESSIKLIDFGFAKLLPANGDITLQLDAAGRATTKASSHHHPRTPKTAQHLDIWQLALSLNPYFNHAKQFFKESNKNDWPIDYADFDRVLALLSQWESLGPNNVTENGDIASFYKAIDDINKYEMIHLSADVKGAVRYFSVPEIATAAQIQPAFQAIRIPHRQHVLYTDRISELITRPEFGVLRYTRQLGFTHLVYPGAQGSRFEHALGVYNLACQLVIRMSGHPDFRKACGKPKDILKFLLACLLHDIGHFPLAHQLEEFKGKDRDFQDRKVWRAVKDLVGGHRAHAKTLIQDNDKLKPFLKDRFKLTDRDLQDILTLMIDKEKIDQKEYERLPQPIKLLNSLLCGPTDLDKFDYIERDANHCGVPYGNFLDFGRALETMHVIEDEGRPIVAFHKRGLGCIEQLATARHQMFANVYWHRAVRSATVMFKHAFYLYSQLFPKKSKLAHLFYSSGSDDAVLANMVKDVKALHKTNPTIVALNQILLAISGKDRVLYKAILHEEHTDATKMKYGGYYYFGQRQVAEKIFRLLKKQGFLINEVDKMGGEHNVLIDCRLDSCPSYEEVKIVNDDGKVEDFVKCAPSISRTRDDFITQACKIRVFVNPLVLTKKVNDKTSRENIGAIVRKKLN